MENSELYNVFQIQTDIQRMTSYKSIKYWYGMMFSSNLDCPSSINNPLPSSWILHPLFSFILPQIPVIQHQFSFFSSSFSILSQKCRIFDLKCTHNIGISDKMSARSACSFFQVCIQLTNIRISSIWCKQTVAKMHLVRQ